MNPEPTSSPSTALARYQQLYRLYASELVRSFALGEFPVDADVWAYFNRIPQQAKLWRDGRALIVAHDETSKAALNAMAEYGLTAPAESD